jgi:hypothetical protein
LFIIIRRAPSQSLLRNAIVNHRQLNRTAAAHHPPDSSTAIARPAQRRSCSAVHPPFHRRQPSFLFRNSRASLPSFNRFAVCISDTVTVHPPSMKSRVVVPSSKVI